MKHSLKNAAKNTIAGLAATGAFLSTGGGDRPLVTDAEKIEAVKQDQEALLHHIGACSIKSIEDTQKDFTDEDGNQRAFLRVHIKSEETPEAQRARTREKFLEGLHEGSMDVSAYMRDPADPSKPLFKAPVWADEDSFMANEPLDNEINVYPIEPSTKTSPWKTKTIDVYMNNFVTPTKDYQGQIVNAKSREHCGTFQGTINPETGQTDWKPVQVEPVPDAVFFDEK